MDGVITSKDISDANIEKGQLKLGKIVLDETKCKAGNVKLGIRPEHFIPSKQGKLKAKAKIAEELNSTKRKFLK